MVVFYGVKRWRSWLFFGAAGGCGSRGPRVVGQPAAAAIAGLRGRPAVRAAIPPRASQAPCPNNNSPDRSSPPGPGAPRMRRFYISARARRNRFRGDSCVLVSYVTLAYSAWSRVFADYAKPGAVPLLFVIKQLLCCARTSLHPSLLETAQYTEISKGPS
jgi:hypothetical protein